MAKLVDARTFTAAAAWGGRHLAEKGSTVRLRWTDQLYRWHVDDGVEMDAPENCRRDAGVLPVRARDASRHELVATCTEAAASLRLQEPTFVDRLLRPGPSIRLVRQMKNTRYFAFSEASRRAAAEASDPELKAAFIEIAEAWINLSQLAEAQEIAALALIECSALAER